MSRMSATHQTSSQDGEKAQGKRATLWTWAKRGVTLFFFIAVPVLLVMLMRNIDWSEVAHTLRSYKLTTLVLGFVLALGSYVTYCGFDVLARYYTKHRLSVKQVVPVAFVCYAFNLNLSSWVGGIAMRYRLYSRLGLDTATITRILSLSLITNWLGYMLLAGWVFALGFVDMPDGWKVGDTGLRLIGVGLLVASGAYLLACRFATRRSFTIARQEIVLPSLKQALAQALLGALNWSLMAALIWVLLPERAFYPTVLGVLLISSIAGVVTHIPAGLGVLETVFIAMMQHQFSKGTLLAGLIGYRVIYFLIPLLLALVVYLVLEKQARRMRGKNERQDRL